MSAREAYIAGRSGGSRPSRGSGGSSGPGSSTQRSRVDEVRQQQAYDSGQQERQREQTINEKGIAGLSQREQDQAKTIAKNTGKDPYDTLTREEEKKAGYPETFSEKAIDAYKEYTNFGGFMGLGILPFRMIAEPTVKTFQNPEALAVLKLLFDRKGQEFKDKYLKDHGDIIGDAFKDERELLKEGGQGITTLDFFNQELDEAARMSEEGVLSAGSQRINFPAEFYTGENSASPYGAGVMPQTSGDLANLAGLDVNQFKSGPGYNQEMVDKIFAARMELDRMDRNPMTGESRLSESYRDREREAAMGGAPVPPVVTPDDPIIPVDPIPAPGTTPPSTTTKYPGSVITDYTQLGLPQIYGNQQMPNYGSFYQGQGGQPVGLQEYLDNLRKRFGIG